MPSLALLAMVAPLACQGPPDSASKADSNDSGQPSETGTESESGDTHADSPGDTDADSPVQTDTDTDSTTETADTEVTREVLELDLETEADAKLVGENEGDADGLTPVSAGDFNGDGYDDLLIGLHNNDRGGTKWNGTAYVVNGPVSGTVGLGDADAILTGSYGDLAGWEVSSAGDTNGDGYDDLLVNGYLGDPSGGFYLVLGPVSGERELATAEAVLLGADDHAASAGDMDGDGYDDVIVNTGGGEVYVAAGPMSYYVDLPLEAVMTITRWSFDNIADGDDIDGDGLSDILFSGGDDDGDACVLFYGPPRGSVTTGDADATFVHPSDAWACDYSPQTVGDVNADGYGDAIIDSYSDIDAGEYSGAAFLGYGPFHGDVDIPSLPAKLTGAAELDFAGYALDGAGDVDADGFADVLVGAPQDGLPGYASLVFGPVYGTMSLADAHWTMRGGGGDEAGSSLCGAGDVDGDGLADLLIGAPHDADGGEDAGAAWLVTGLTLTGG